MPRPQILPQAQDRRSENIPGEGLDVISIWMGPDIEQLFMESFVFTINREKTEIGQNLAISCPGLLTTPISIQEGLLGNPIPHPVGPREDWRTS